MSAEKFLKSFFNKLVPKDFQKDKFLEAFYKFYFKEKHPTTFKKIIDGKASKAKFLETADKLFEKTKHKTLFPCYIEYLVRNKQFQTQEEKENAYDELYKSIVDEIKSDGRPKEEFSVFDREMAKPFINSNKEVVSKTTKKKKKIIETPTEPTSSTEPVNPKAPFKLNKSKALSILSNYIEQSSIITYEDPEQVVFKEDQDFRENTTSNIEVEILADGRSLPEPKKDVVFGQRNDMMNIWKDTEKKCHKLVGIEYNEKGERIEPEEVSPLSNIIGKLWFIDLSQFINEDQTIRPDSITTVDEKEVRDLLPVEKFMPEYTSNQYQTVVKLVNNHPVEETVNIAKQKIRCLYIMGGSQMISGGNADQGIDVTESMIFLTSTYSYALEKALHAYPLSLSHALLCPQVLVFKDAKYTILPSNKWQRIAVMNAPTKFRPSTNLKDQATTEFDERLYNSSTEMSKSDANKIRNTLMAALEAALFFKYDSIILDDRGIDDNWLAAHHTAKIIKEVVGKFNGRFRSISIAVSKSKVFKVFRLYFNC